MTLGIYNREALKPEIGRWKAQMIKNEGLTFEIIDLKVGPCPDEMWDTVQTVASEFVPVEISNIAHAKAIQRRV